MKFVGVFRSRETTIPPTAEQIAAMGKLTDEMTRAGVLLMSGGCLPSSTGALVRKSKGAITVTDGPFAESKEVIGGFAVFRVSSKAEALEWTRRFLAVAGDGESEVRQLFEE
jgi:hypothetical protein